MLGTVLTFSSSTRFAEVEESGKKCNIACILHRFFSSAWSPPPPTPRRSSTHGGIIAPLLEGTMPSCRRARKAPSVPGLGTITRRRMASMWKPAAPRDPRARATLTVVSGECFKKPCHSGRSLSPTSKCLSEACGLVPHIIIIHVHFLRFQLAHPRGWHCPVHIRCRRKWLPPSVPAHPHAPPAPRPRHRTNPFR